MSNYTKSTDFASKDALPSGNAGKIVKGTEIDTEFNNIATAIATKADTASPSFSGTANFSTIVVSTATISGGEITGITDLAIDDGGTGASTAADARSNLGTVADTASNGIAARTSANTLTARTITAGTGISVSNGDGVSGNPTITNSGVTSFNGGTGAITGVSSVNGNTGSVTVGPNPMTAVNSTSGTYFDFTSIPSWAKRITVTFNDVSVSGTSAIGVQLGAGSIQTTGYKGGGIRFGTSGVYGETLYTTNMGTALLSLATDSISGQMIITTNGSNGWVASGTYYINTTNMGFSTGGVTLGGTLDRVRIYTVNGSDTFDAGVINVLYE